MRFTFLVLQCFPEQIAGTRHAPGIAEVLGIHPYHLAFGFGTRLGNLAVPFVNEIEMEDPFENAGAQIIGQAAVNTNNEAGDGTTTSTVLARAILMESQRHIAAGIPPVELQRGIHLAVTEVVENLKSLVEPIKSIDDIEHIGDCNQSI